MGPPGLLATQYVARPSGRRRYAATFFRIAVAMLESNPEVLVLGSVEPAKPGTARVPGVSGGPARTRTWDQGIYE